LTNFKAIPLSAFFYPTERDRLPMPSVPEARLEGTAAVAWPGRRDAPPDRCPQLRDDRTKNGKNPGGLIR
jgi:hypothetical protein